MTFFKFSDMVRSWSNWAFAAIAAVSQAAEYIPVIQEQGVTLYTTVLAVVGVFVRSIKQK